MFSEDIPLSEQQYHENGHDNGKSNMTAADTVPKVDRSGLLDADASFQSKYRQLLRANQQKNEQAKHLAAANSEQNKHQSLTTENDINFYVRRLMQDLVSNLQYVNEKTPVAVTDFVMLDSDFNQANLLSFQISESLVHEIHKFGIPVIDYKSTGYIRVTEKGDFMLTRNFQELSGELPIRYVFVGTLTKHQSGYFVNAKVVGVVSKAVVGSAQSFIPNSVADSLIASAPAETPAQKNMVAITLESDTSEQAPE